MFDWGNFLSLVIFSPFQSLFYLRLLSPKLPRGLFFLYNCLYYIVMAAFNILLTGIFDTNTPGSLATLPLTIIYIGSEFLGYLLIWKRTTSDPFRHKLLAYVLNAVLITLGTAIGMAAVKLIEATAAPGDANPVFSTNGTIAMVTCFQSLTLFVGSDVIARRIRRIAVDVRWNMIIILLIAQVVAFLFVSVALDWLSMNPRNALLVILYALVCVLLDIYILRTFRSMVKNAELEQQVALLDQQKEFERALYHAAGEQMTGMRQLRHDYINTLTTVGTLLRMDEQGKALALLNDTTSALEKTRIVRTGNQIADAVLYSKTLSAAEADIQIRCGLLWPESFQMADTDLMRLLSNLLDNAIRYCKTLPAGREREIAVTSRLQGRMFALCISNPYFSDVPPAIPAPGSDAPTGEHGHGLAIVRGILETYGGTLTNDCDGRTLTFRAVLSLPEPEPAEDPRTA